MNASSSPGENTYTLVATGSDGYGNNMQVQKQIDISVRNNPNLIGTGNMIKSFSASRNTVQVGESFTKKLGLKPRRMPPARLTPSTAALC